LQGAKNFLCTSNGTFIEIVHATTAAGSRVMGVVMLDSLRCTRTGNPEIPVIYEDSLGREHLMKAHQVACFSDMPSSDPNLRGIGESAADRAYPTIVKAAAIERYKIEKITGSRPQALFFVNGVSPEQVKKAIQMGEADMLSEGSIAYMGAIVIPSARNTPVDVSQVDLASLPDGWDAAEERESIILQYANSIGIFVGDLRPLRESGLSNGVETAVLDEAAEGMGIAAFRKQMEHIFTWEILPVSTMFTFSNKNDPRRQKLEAENTKLRADARKVMKENEEITGEEARQMAIDAGDIGPSIAEDTTPSGSLSSNQKVPDLSEIEIEPGEFDVPDLGDVQPMRASFAETMKSIGVEDAEKFLKAELPSARSLYTRIRKKVHADS
jgi:hypothetical protein